MVSVIYRYAGFLFPAFWSFGLLAGVYWSGGSMGVAKLMAVEASLALFVSVFGWGQNSILLAGYWSTKGRDSSRLLGHSLVTILLIGGIALVLLAALTSLGHCFYPYTTLPLLLVACAALTDCLIGLVGSFYKACLSLLALCRLLAAYYVIPLLYAYFWLPGGDVAFIGAAIIGRTVTGIALVTIVTARRAQVWPLDFSTIWQKHISQGASLVPAAFASQFLLTFPRIMMVQLCGMAALERIALSLKASGLLQALLFNPIGQLWLVYALRLNYNGKTIRENQSATAFISAAIVAASLGLAGILVLLTGEQPIQVLLTFGATAMLPLAIFYNTGVYYREQLQLMPIVYIPALAVAFLNVWLFGRTPSVILAAWCSGIGALSLSGWLVSSYLQTKPLSLSVIFWTMAGIVSLSASALLTNYAAWIVLGLSIVALLFLVVLPIASKYVRSDLVQAFSMCGMVPENRHRCC